MNKRTADTDRKEIDPYAGNSLVSGLGPIRSRKEILAALTELPRRSANVANLPAHIALHELMRLRDLYMPGLAGVQLHETIDLMIRQNYRYLNPTDPVTWSIISGEPGRNTVRSAEFGGAVVGHSGTGKTQAILRCLGSYPRQTVVHESFPRMVGPHMQVVWQSVNVPASGRSSDLAASLMEDWDRITGMGRFELSLSRERRNGMKMLEEWRQVAAAHFLGLLHLDEVQNLFKLSALKKRSKRSGLDDAPELSIVEDQVLKWILTLMNTWHIPLLVSGTPDGIDALMRRLSNAQRIVSSGFHVFPRFSADDISAFRRGFLDQLGKYQYVAQPIRVDDDLARLVLELTAGVHRLIVALWIGAHRIALERNSGDLLIDDFKKASMTLLAPVRPAVAALNSNEPKLMSRYEDLLPRSPSFWSQFGI